MEPGRELDALIAKKVMGIDKWILPPSESGSKVIKANDPPFLNKYSTDIKAAWEVVEKVKDIHGDSKGHIKICVYRKNNYGFGWVKQFGEPYDLSSYKEASTMPHAICLAALKAVGHEIKRHNKSAN